MNFDLEISSMTVFGNKTWFPRIGVFPLQNNSQNLEVTTKYLCILQVVKLKDEERWIPFEQIEEECNTLRRKAGQPPRQKAVFEGWETKVDNYLITAVKAHMSRFFPREDAEELLFGPGIPNAEIKVIQAYAASLKLRCDTRQFNEETYLVVYHRQDMQKVVQELKKLNGGNYGKYKLVSRDELPNSDSIKHLMKGQQSL